MPAQSDARPASPAVRYYKVTTWGRSLMSATTDADAILEAEEYAKKYPTAAPVKRIVRETKETIYEDRSAISLGEPVGRCPLGFL